MEILYEDRQLSIFRDRILIKRSNTPQTASKQIQISEIAAVKMEDGKTAPSSQGGYLSVLLQMGRNRTKTFKSIEFELKKSNLRPAVTPEQPDRVFRILFELFGYHQKAEEQSGGKENWSRRELSLDCSKYASTEASLLKK